MTSTIIITTLIGLVLASYGWIFKTVIDRIKKNEKNKCDKEIVVSFTKRLEKIEEKQSDNDVIFVEIKTSLARIEESILWLKEQK